MNGLVEDFSPGVVIILVADTDQVGTDRQSGDIEVNRGDRFDFGIKCTILCGKSRTTSFTRVSIDEIFRGGNGGVGIRKYHPCPKGKKEREIRVVKFS